MYGDPTGPHKLKYNYKKPQRKPIDPPLVNTFADVAGLLHLKTGKRVQLATARGTLFFATVNHERRCADGYVPIMLPWDTWVYPGDWGWTYSERGAHIATYCRALDEWASIYTGMTAGDNV